MSLFLKLANRIGQVAVLHRAYWNHRDLNHRPGLYDQTCVILEAEGSMADIAFTVKTTILDWPTYTIAIAKLYFNDEVHWVLVHENDISFVEE